MAPTGYRKASTPVIIQLFLKKSFEPSLACLLIYEHSLVKPDDFSRVDAAFFTVNGYVSVLFFVFWAADIFLFKPGV